MGLYLTLLLYTMGIEVNFLLRMMTVAGIFEMIFVLAKNILHIPNSSTEMSRFWDKYMFFMIYFGAPMVCVFFTVFANIKIKMFFVAWMLIILLLGIIIKHKVIRLRMLVLVSIMYGFVLAKWYLMHPLEGSFGNNGIEESIVIMLSAVMAILPVCVMSIQEES